MDEMESMILEQLGTLNDDIGLCDVPEDMRAEMAAFCGDLKDDFFKIMEEK